MNSRPSFTQAKKDEECFSNQVEQNKEYFPYYSSYIIEVVYIFEDI